MGNKEKETTKVEVGQEQTGEQVTPATPDNNEGKKKGFFRRLGTVGKVVAGVVVVAVTGGVVLLVKALTGGNNEDEETEAVAESTDE